MIFKAKKKPVEVECMTLTWDNYSKLPDFMEVAFMNGATFVFVAMESNKILSSDMSDGALAHTPRRLGLLIPTLEGDMLGVEGDIIIKGVNGEFYPCKPDIFEKTYEVVS